MVTDWKICHAAVRHEAFRFIVYIAAKFRVHLLIQMNLNLCLRTLNAYYCEIIQY